MDNTIVISNMTIRGLNNLCNILIERGYTPYGDIIYGDGFFYQSLKLRKKIINNREKPYRRIIRNRK